MSDILLYYSLLNPFSLVLLFWPTEPCFASHKHLVAVEFCSPTNSSMIFPPASPFIIPITFLGKLLVLNLASRSHIAYICRSLHLQSHGQDCPSLWREILHDLPTPSLFSYSGSHTSESCWYRGCSFDRPFSIDGLIKCQFSSLHVDCNKVFLNYHAMLELCFCSELRCFLQVVD